MNEKNIYRELAETVVTHTGSLDFVFSPPEGDRVEPPWQELDEGIRDLAIWLWEEGYEPTDSGDGSKVETMGCALPFAHVFMLVRRPPDLITEVERLQGLLDDRGDMGDWKVEGNYAPGGPAILMLMQEVS